MKISARYALTTKEQVLTTETVLSVRYKTLIMYIQIHYGFLESIHEFSIYFDGIHLVGL